MLRDCHCHDELMRVVVVGGGISGLAVAWELSARADVVVLEAADQVGGKLRLGSLAGVDLDVGAESILARRPEGVALVRASGLADALIEPLTTAAGVLADGRIRAIPSRTMLGIPTDPTATAVTDLLSADAVAAIAGEPQREPLPPMSEDLAVGTVVRARLGNEVVDRLVEPLLAGVYAGRADALSLRATAPALARELQLGGSLVDAARRALTGSAPDGSDQPLFAAVAGGVGRLPQALVASGRFAVRTRTTVRELRRTPTGFALECGPVARPQQLSADAVIVATPASKAAQLLRDVAPAAAKDLAAIDSASVAIVSLAYQNTRLPPGSGFLVAAGEPYAVKGVTFSSQKWPGTPAGLVMLRASLGRAGQTRDLQHSDEELIALVRRELTKLLGISPEPIDAIVTRWGGGLPQYAVGHVERVARVRSAVAAVPGLAVCGATYDGIGIAACVASAHAAAAQIRAAVLW
jgi:protoporphyrinogen/coproporphyrinogen III oxidase